MANLFTGKETLYVRKAEYLKYTIVRETISTKLI